MSTQSTEDPLPFLMPKDERLVSIDQVAPMTSLRILLFSAVFEVPVAIADLIAANSGVIAVLPSSFKRFLILSISSLTLFLRSLLTSCIVSLKAGKSPGTISEAALLFISFNFKSWTMVSFVKLMFTDLHHVVS